MKTMEAGRLVWKGLFGGVPELSLEELKAYRAEHHEDSYTLLDVRQPGEYEKEHLPGALLIPLPQLEGRVGELDQAKPVIAYCAIGGRSRAAAEMLSGRGFDEVYSLAGGIEAWKGEVAKGPAQAGLGLLKGDETLAGLLAVVYGLEKGLGGFYLAAAEMMPDAHVAELMRNLAGIEDRHVAKVLDMFEAASPGPQEQAALEEAGGDTVEGGFSAQELQAQFKESNMAAPELIDWAMALEAQAMDLYLRLAQRAAEPAAQAALRQVGNEEKAHLESLARLREQQDASETTQ
jgi:rhodanese-related sulfurtransferase/rubrerythrin